MTLDNYQNGLLDELYSDNDLKNAAIRKLMISDIRKVLSRFRVFDKYGELATQYCDDIGQHFTVRQLREKIVDILDLKQTPSSRDIIRILRGSQPAKEEKKELGELSGKIQQVKERYIKAYGEEKFNLLVEDYSKGVWGKDWNNSFIAIMKETMCLHNFIKAKYDLNGAIELGKKSLNQK